MESLRSVILLTERIPSGMIDFGSGQPGMDLLPLPIIRPAAEAQLGRIDPSFLAYGANQGNGYFRIALAQFLGEHY